MNSFYKYILGGIRYSVNTSNPSKIAGELMKEFPESVCDVTVTDNYSFEFFCTLFSKKKIINSEFLRDANVTEISVYGVPFAILKYKKRYGLALGALLFAFIIYLQSLFVWDMRISGNDTISDTEIRQTLSSLGFGQGSLIAASELSEIQNRFLIREERISWISINMSGTVAFVEVKERNLKNAMPEVPSMSGVLSFKDGIVELCEVTSGTSLVSAGDTVQKGQMLISPIALGKDGSEYLSGAYGKILARTYEEFSITVQYCSQKAAFTGRECTAHDISILGKTIEIRPPVFIKFENYLCTEEREKIKLFEGAVLPVEKTTKKMLEYEISEEIITPSDAKKTAYGKMYSKISEELPDAEIISTEFAEEEGDDSFILKCRVECIRNIAVIGEN